MPWPTRSDGVRVAIQEDSPAAEHPARQRHRSSVEQHDVHRVGPELTCRHTRHGELRRMQVHVWRDEDRQIDVAARRRRTSRGAAEQVGEEHSRTRRADGVSQATQASVDIRRQIQLSGMAKV